MEKVNKQGEILFSFESLGIQLQVLFAHIWQS